MTVSSNYSPKSFKPGAAMSAEALGWPLLEAAHLSVVHVAAATGVRTAKTLNNDYEVTGNLRTGGGAIRALAVYPALDDWIVSRVTPALQQIDLRAHESLPAEDVELELDRRAMVEQETAGSVSALEARSVRVPVGEVLEELPGQALRVLRWLMFDAVGAIALATAATAAAAIAPHLPAELKGEPGGNISATGSLLATKSMIIPAGTKMVRTTHHGVRYGKGGAEYREKDVAEPAPPAWAENIAWFTNSVDGRVWIINEEVPNAWQFGLVADGTYNFATDLVGGTDESHVLNNLRRWCLLYGKRLARVPGEGMIRIENPILSGLGEDFSTFVFWGLEAGYPVTSDRLRGTTLITSRNDIPVCVIQGGRKSGFVGFHVRGPAYKYIWQNLLGYAVGSGPAFDDRQRNVWLPAGAHHKNGRYNAGCAFAFDPYSGIRPIESYPDCPFDAAAGESAVQYMRSPSSEPIVRFCSVEGFSVGVGSQLCDFDGNSDYVRMNDFECNFSVVPIAVGNSQCRAIDTRNLKWALVHTVMDGVAYGKQRGKLQGNHSNWCGGHQNCIVDYSPGFTGPLTISQGYLEGGYRLAIVRGSEGGALRFEDCDLTLYLDAGSEAKRGVAIAHVDSDGAGGMIRLPIYISGQMSVNECLMINSQTVETNLHILARRRSNGFPIRPSEVLTHNGSAGGILVPQAFGGTRESVIVRTTYSPIERDGGGNASAALGAVAFDGTTAEAPSRVYTAPLYATRARPQNTRNAIDLPLHGGTASGGTAYSLNGRTVKLTFAGFFNAGHVMRFAMYPGALWFHNVTKRWFEVTDYEIATDVVTLHLKNGYIDTAGVISYSEGVAPNFGAGAFTTYGTSRFVPSYALSGDFTSASHIVTNVGLAGGTGAATGLATDLIGGNYGVGDYLFADPDAVGVMWQPRHPIASVDAVAKTITGISGFNPARTLTSQRLIALRAAVSGVANP